MRQTILSLYKNSPFIQAAAVQFHKRKDRSHHELSLSQTRVSMHFMRFETFPYRHCSLCS